MLRLHEGLQDKFDKAVALLEEHDKFRIFTHYDADGISAAAVISRMFMKSSKGFHATFIHSFPEKIPDDLPIIFTDIGASHSKAISELSSPAIVLDHHRIDEYPDEKENKIFINPHEFDIDGAQEVSGGTLAFILAVSYDDNNWVKAIYGLSGAAADKQNIGGFKGVNKDILDEALERDVLKVEEGIHIDGRGVREALLLSCDPYFPGISGRNNKIDNILADIDLDPATPVDEIPGDKERKLTSLLALSLLKHGAPAFIVESVRGRKYISPIIETSVDVLYKLLNACSRVSRPGLALSFCLGDSGAREVAEGLREDYRQNMVQRMMEFEKEGPVKLENIQYFYESQKARKGELAGLGMLYLFDRSKPAFGLSKVNGRVDASVRGTKELVERGLDLGKLCREISAEFGGSGGGHNIASGATVDEEHIDDFLKRMDEDVGKLLKDD